MKGIEDVDHLSSPIQLLALDMDGTLFREDLHVADAVRQAIAEAQAAGVLVALATGRMPAAARDFVRMLALHGPQIFSNGGLVVTTDGEVLLDVPVETATAREIIAYTRANNLHLNVYIGDDILVDRLTPEADFTRQLNRIQPTAVPDLVERVATPPTKLVVVRLPRVEAGLIPRLRGAFGDRVRISSSVPQYVEMVNPLVDKGRALRLLADRLGIPIGATAAIGDGDNDATLLGAAGLPIAMGNATPRLKELARHVVGTVEENGVAEAIERYILPTRRLTPLEG